MEILLLQVRFLKKLAQTEPFKSLIKREVDPGDVTEVELRSRSIGLLAHSMPDAILSDPLLRVHPRHIYYYLA